MLVLMRGIVSTAFFWSAASKWSDWRSWLLSVHVGTASQMGMARIAAWTVAVAEVVVAAACWMRPEAGLLTAAALWVCFAVWMILAESARRTIDCHCFGVRGETPTLRRALVNIVLAVASAGVALATRPEQSHSTGVLFAQLAFSMSGGIVALLAVQVWNRLRESVVRQA